MTTIKRNLTKSAELWERAEKIIPCGTQTLSKAPNQFVQGVYPIYIQRGLGSHVFDVDGNEYIDYPMALGPILLGHAYPATIEAVTRQLQDGITFTLMHPLEVELAEIITECVPGAEMVRFAKNGSDATTAAVRIARAYTGRELIAYCGYHGWQDWYAAGTERNKGLPVSLRSLLLPFKYNDLASLGKLFQERPGQIAAVIMEQGVEDPQDGFLHKVRDLAHRNGAVLIFDEIVTGFRFALGGIQEYYGVTADLVCLGKGMANGMPISAVAGRRDLMKELEEVFFSMTFGGETLSLAASIATIKEIREKDVIPYIWEQGAKLREGVIELITQNGINAQLVGHPPRSGFVFRDAAKQESMLMKGLFMQECVKRGVLFGGPVFISYSHTDDDIEKTLEATGEALHILKKAVEEDNIPGYLEGTPPGVVFRRMD